MGSKITLARTGDDAGSHSFRRPQLAALEISNGTIFVSEVTGTAILLLLGCGVVATAILKGSKGEGGGWLLINFGWGLAVYAGVYVAARTGGSLNPAVTLAFLMAGDDSPVQITFNQALVYWAGEFVGAFVGAVLAWLAFKDHFDAEEDPGKKLGVFSTGPAIRNYAWNTVTEVLGTFVLVFLVFMSGGIKTTIGPLFVALLIVGIGASLGGPTGYAINPARDLGPRIAHLILPIKGKGSSDWAYSWVPIVGPMIGGALGAWAFLLLGGTGVFPVA